MKLISIIFITLNSISKHLSHASQMHTHAYIWRVCDSEPYSGIQRATQTFVDPYGPQHVYAPCGHIFLLFSMFFFSYFLPKSHYHHPLYHWQSYDRLSTLPQHHVWLHPLYILLFIPYSPVICKDFFPLVYMYKLSTMLYSTSIWVLYSLSQLFSKSWDWLHCSFQALWLILPATSWSYH